MIIAGAGGHAKEIFMLLNEAEQKSISFFDNLTACQSSTVFGVELLQSEDKARKKLREDPRFIIGTGKPDTRKYLFDLFVSWGGQAHGFQASSALVSHLNTCIREGVNFMHQALISVNVKVGVGSLVNARAHLHHDVNLGDFCEVGPGALLLGDVTVGNHVSIGAGAILLPGVRIADRVIIGAGAVVTKDVAAGRKVKGVPAV